MPYIKKIKSKSAQALDIYLKSKHYLSRKEHAAAVRNNPEFQKEYAQMLRKHPLIIDDNLLRHLETKQGREKLSKNRKVWNDFQDKWGINILTGSHLNSKMGVVIGRNEKNEPTLTIISKYATRQDVEDHIPLLMDVARATYGPPPITQGLKKGHWAKRDTEIRDTFKRLKKAKMKSKDIFADLAARHDLSEITVQRIIYGKK